MPSPQLTQLSRRERQIMDILYQLDLATVAAVKQRMSDPPSYSAVRAMLRVLEDKGHVKHHQDGPRYVYRPTLPRDRAVRSALRHLIRTFFEGSTEGAVTALLEMDAQNLSPGAIQRMGEAIKKAKKEGR